MLLKLFFCTTFSAFAVASRNSCLKSPQAKFLSLSRHAAAQQFCSENNVLPPPCTSSTVTVTVSRDGQLAMPGEAQKIIQDRAVSVSLTGSARASSTVSASHRITSTSVSDSPTAVSDHLESLYTSLVLEEQPFISRVCSCMVTIPPCGTATTTVTAASTAS
jgi:hypothetical protein